MTKTLEALTLAEEALTNYENTLLFLVPSPENIMRKFTLAGGDKALAAIREAKAQEQAEQEPVAEQTDKSYSVFDHLGYCPECGAENPPEKSDHEFKNFHRLLCERFDYGHDEKDWKRDQLSLIEWIANTALREALEHSGEADEMVGCAYCNNPLFAGTKCNNCGRVVSQPVSQEYQDHLVNQSFDWSAMAAKHQFMEGYRIGLAEMREKCAKVVTEHAPTCSPHWVSYVVAIRAIKFEGDTGFRPVSEMIAEHKQDPKKAAAIEKAKMRKAEQEPVAFQMICPRCKVDRVTTPCPRGGVSDCPMTATAQKQPVKQEPVAIVNHEAGGSQKVTWLTLEGLADGAELYLHPVRTKDLTDEEIRKLWSDAELDITWFARAAIAADRSKNGIV